MKKSKLMLIFMAGNDHTVNLRTIDGVTKQSCLSDIRFVICNDAKNYFKCEATVDALRNSKKTDSFTQVILHENETAIGIDLSVKQFKNKFESDFIAVVRPGEVFEDISALRSLMIHLESTNSTEIKLGQFCTVYKSEHLGNTRIPEYAKESVNVLGILRKVRRLFKK